MSEHQNIIMEIQKCPATRTYSTINGGVGVKNRGPAGGGLLKLKSTRMLYTSHGE
jgi:hypothetical protein